MRRQHVDVRVHAPADPAAVYVLVSNGASWPTWTSIESAELERPGDNGEPEGVGAIRVFRTGRYVSRERIVELVPDRRLSYVLVSGLAVRDYRADIELEPSETGGTDIHWRSSFRPKVPGTGWLYRRTLQRYIERYADGLAAHVATRPARH